MRIAMVQMPVTHDKRKNLDSAGAWIAHAAQNGADLVVLPEMFCCPYSNQYFRSYGEREGGAVWQELSALAKKHEIYLVGGSIPELEGTEIYNTSYVFDREGKQIAKHRKVHLFDIDVPGGQQFFESAVLSAGNEVTVFDTEYGKIGLCICFDFRFQELAKCMADKGAELIVVPAAFNMTTGPAHWELLFRQRAVDNQIFTMGVAPARTVTEEYISYGNSILADPWGSVLCRAGTGEECLLYEIQQSRIAEVRRQLPILHGRRPDVYGHK